MNAENKINANNTWSLQLIENMDKIIAPNIPATNSEANKSAPSAAPGTPSREDESAEQAEVNFAKASCTLDASVKIYSYRVDDVHLSSYKVLANLNRTGDDHDEDGNEDGAGGNGSKKKSSVGGKYAGNFGRSVQTLETNAESLNMNKLDSAFDIDPLFHKMSKTFDEGGAKGMLLANLSVSTDTCGIVFDSKQVSFPQAAILRLLIPTFFPYCAHPMHTFRK